MGCTFYVAVKALVFYKEKFLIVKRSDAARGDHYYWELPGGRLEFGESPDDTLMRELLEETGLAAKPIHPIQTWSFFRGEDTQIVGITFLCKTNTNLVELSTEHEAYAWITPDDLNQYDFIPSVLHSLEKLNINKIYDQLKSV